jgi:hypothetical protein
MPTKPLRALRVTIQGDPNHRFYCIPRLKLNTGSNGAAEFRCVQFVEVHTGGYFRNIRTTARRAANFHRAAKFQKEKKSNHENDERDDAGNDNRSGPVHPDPQSILG